MAEHTLSLRVDERKRYTNDPVYHDDVESQMIKLLETWWDTANTQSIKPRFYLTEKEITHDLADAPAIVLFEQQDATFPVGLGFVAERIEMPIVIEIFSLDRGMMYDTKDEVHRILNFCRKRPIEDWDFIKTTSNRRAEPRAGNYHFVTTATLIRLVKPIPYIRPPKEIINILPVVEVIPSLYVAINVHVNDRLW